MKIVDKTLLEVLIEEGFEWKSEYEYLAQDSDGDVYCYEQPPYKHNFSKGYWGVVDNSMVSFYINLNYVSFDHKYIYITKQQYLDAVKKGGCVNKSVDSVDGVCVRSMNGGWVEVDNNSIDHLMRELQAVKDLAQTKHDDYVKVMLIADELNDKIITMLVDKGLNI